MSRVRQEPAAFPSEATIIPRMFRLTREVRLAVNSSAADQARLLRLGPTNGYAGFPSLTGLGPFFALPCTVTGGLDSRICPRTPAGAG